MILGFFAPRASRVRHDHQTISPNVWTKDFNSRALCGARRNLQLTYSPHHVILIQTTSPVGGSNGISALTEKNVWSSCVDFSLNRSELSGAVILFQKFKPTPRSITRRFDFLVYSPLRSAIVTVIDIDFFALTAFRTRSFTFQLGRDRALEVSQNDNDISTHAPRAGRDRRTTRRYRKPDAF